MFGFSFARKINALMPKQIAYVVSSSSAFVRNGRSVAWYLSACMRHSCAKPPTSNAMMLHTRHLWFHLLSISLVSFPPLAVRKMAEIRQMMPAMLIHVAFSPQARTAQTNDTAKPMRHSPKYTAALPFPSVSMPK